MIRLQRHTCQAEGCENPIARRSFLCTTHWQMVPMNLRDEIWSALRPGTGKAKRLGRPVSGVLAQSAVEVVAVLEGRRG